MHSTTATSPLPQPSRFHADGYSATLGSLGSIVNPMSVCSLKPIGGLGGVLRRVSSSTTHVASTMAVGDALKRCVTLVDILLYHGALFPQNYFAMSNIINIMCLHHLQFIQRVHI